MKNYNTFLNSKKYEIELNEGLFDMFKKLFNKINQYVIKTKGGKEVDAIYQKYIKKIGQEFVKLGLTELNIGDSTMPIKETIYISKYNNFLNEANEQVEDSEELEKNKSTTIQMLKQKSQTINKIIELYKEKALKEMNAILNKYGGSDKNPKLAIIINNKKDQFNLDVLNAKVAYLEKAGDKSLINTVRIERDKLSKQLNAQWQGFDKTGAAGGQLVANSIYRYNSANGLKTIKYLRPSQTQGKAFAKYLISEDGIVDKEQEFRTENIVVDYKDLNLKVGDKYNYYDEEQNKVIEVEIINYDESNNTIKLKSNGNEFDGHLGCLRDKIGGDTEEQAKPEENKSEEGNQ